MYIKRKSLIKWSLIVTFCGAHSFFWGVMVRGDWRAMVAGLVTIILAYSLVDSHAAYQRRREAAPRLARALDWGIKVRIWLTVYALVGVLASGMLSSTVGATISMLVLWPYAGEVMIGMGAAELNRMLIGVNGVRVPSETNANALAGSGDFIATYVTTLITGAMHAIILAMICGLAYGVIRLRGRKKKEEQPHG